MKATVGNWTILIEHKHIWTEILSFQNFIKNYWLKIFDMLMNEEEYVSPYHEDKQQLEIPFKNNF